MAKDGCNNMEKNAILRRHDAGQEIPEIARALRLTERIVENMISYHRPDSEVEVEAKTAKEIDTGLNDSIDETAGDEFDDSDED